MVAEAVEQNMISILFSPKPFVGNDAVNQRNALASWRRIAGDVELICYGDGEGVAEACAEFGARQVKDIPLSETAAPMFDWIVQHAEREAKYDLQMFINADIFLLPEFTDAIAHIPFDEFLAVSDRLNVPEGFLSLLPLEDAGARILKVIGDGEAGMNGGQGSDFFIFRRGFWKGLPPIAAGRALYDNVLMAYCIRRRAALIDATPGILVLHPKHNYKHVSGGRAAVYGGGDVAKNRQMLGFAEPPILCDASHVLYPEGVRVNMIFHGWPHRFLIRTQLLHPGNYLMRFLARVTHFVLTRMGIGRPRIWEASKIVRAWANL